MYVITWQNRALNAPVLIEGTARTIKAAMMHCIENSDRDIHWVHVKYNDNAVRIGEFRNAKGEVIAAWTIYKPKRVD